MRICLLGEFSGDLDEGMRKSSFYLTKELSKNHQTLPLDLRTVASESFWREFKKFDPQIIHYIHGASLKSFTLLKIISLYCRNAKTVISMTRPYLSISKHLISFMKPDLTLVQSDRMESMFKALNCRTEFLPIGGVDVEKFNPNLRIKKDKLREKYGIDKDEFVILHVGSIKRGRNVLLLKKLQEKHINNQVIIAGAVSAGIHQEVLHQLEKAACMVWMKYFEHIEEIYALSDCYVFPVVLKRDIMWRYVADSIEMPLSVLEAMSCNLPVISTRFGGLSRVFNEGGGLFFVDGEDDFVATLENIRCDDITIKTREKVLPFSWEGIGEKLEENYAMLVGEDK